MGLAGTIYASCPSSLGFGVEAQSHSNFLPSTVGVSTARSLRIIERLLVGMLWGRSQGVRKGLVKGT